MNTNLLSDVSTRAGTIGGTVLVVLLQINGSQLLETAVLGVVGAVVSFGTSQGLRYLAKWVKEYRTGNKE
jgi:hypothetical protein